MRRAGLALALLLVGNVAEAVVAVNLRPCEFWCAAPAIKPDGDRLFGRWTRTPSVDNFNRANGALGANWWVAAGGNALTILTSNRAGRTGAGSGYAYWSADTFPPDQYAEAYCDFAGSPNSQTLLFVRATPGASNTLNGYAFAKSVSSTTLYRVTGISYTTLATCSVAAAKPIVRIEVVGSRINVYEMSAHNGARTLACSATDAVYATGAPGLSAGGQFGGGYWDDFYAGGF